MLKSTALTAVDFLYAILGTAKAVPKIALYPIKKAIPSLDEGAQIFYTSERYGIEGTAPFLETAMEDALALILRISGIGIPSIRPVKK